MKNYILNWAVKPTVGSVGITQSFGLLLLRLWLGLPLLMLHGMAKWSDKANLLTSFPDPLGMGSALSFYGAVFAEIVCASLIVLGLMSRPALVVAVGFISVAFFKVHGGALSGAHSGELAYVYLGGFLTLLICGPGRFSVDYLLSRSGGSR